MGPQGHAAAVLVKPTAAQAAPTSAERKQLAEAGAREGELDEDKAIGLASALAGDGLAAAYLDFLQAMKNELVVEKPPWGMCSCRWGHMLL